MKSNPVFLSVMAALCAINGTKAQETADPIGWLQTATGTYFYNDPANWANGNVNGLFGTNLNAKATIRMRHKTPLMLKDGDYSFYNTGEVTFEFVGNETTTPLPAYLTEDVTFFNPNATASGKLGNIRFGSSTSTEQLYLDLGAETRTIRSTFDLYLWQSVQNGSFRFGSTPMDIFKYAYFVNEACVEDGDVEALHRTGIVFQNNSNFPGKTRARNLILNNARLTEAFSSAPLITETLTGDIIVNPSDCKAGGYNIIDLSRGYNKHFILQANAIRRKDNAILAINGSIGASGDREDATAVSKNIYLATPPETIQTEGAQGPKAIGIIPWLVLHSQDEWMTYDAERGIRPLDATEYAIYGTDEDVTGLNLVIPKTTTNTVDTALTVNSLILEATDEKASTILQGEGTIHVTSGGVIIGYHRNATPMIRSNIDFGSARGYVYAPKGKGSRFDGIVSGSNGIVFAQMDQAIEYGSGGTGPTLAETSNISGDCYVYSKLSGGGKWWPYGDRLGDIYNYGIIEFSNTTFNGINGSGDFIKSGSGAGSMKVGDNDANGDFTGNIKQGGATSLTKIGAGTQRLTGVISTSAGVFVEEGSLINDGVFSNTVTTVRANARLAGSGRFLGKSDAATTLTIESDATLAPTRTEAGPMTIESGNLLLENGAILDFGDLSVTPTEGNEHLLVSEAIAASTEGDTTVFVSANPTRTGKWLLAKADSIAPHFVVAPGTSLRIFLNEDGTELWGEHFAQTFLLFK